MSDTSLDDVPRTDPVPGGRVTIKDVAARAGVHPSTVSRALDPRQRGRVGAPTRERVIATAERLGYQVDSRASGLRRQESLTIGVLLPDLANPVYAALLQGVNNRLEQADYTALLVETRESPERFRNAVRVLTERRVDGVICAAAHSHDAPPLRRLQRARNVPLVMALRWIDEISCPVIANDDREGGALAARHLLGLGHRSIWQLRGSLDIATFGDRADGFTEVAAAAGVRPVTEAVPGLTVEDTHHFTAELLRRLPPPTAVFAHSDIMAIGAIAALREAGLQCPRDVSVVGYNDVPFSAYLAPPLSTVHMPLWDLGRLAAHVVLDLVAGEGPATAGLVSTVRPVFVARGSTAPPTRP